MDEDDGSGEPFFAHYAQTSRAALSAALRDIEKLRPDQSSLLQTAADEFLLQEAKRDFKDGVARLFEILDRIASTLDRGDAYLYVNQVADAMLSIGIRLGATDQAQALAAKALQRARGQESGKIRKGKQGLWQAHSDVLMAKIEATNPSLSADEMAQRIRNKWSLNGVEMPAHSTVATHVKRKRRES